MFEWPSPIRSASSRSPAPRPLAVEVGLERLADDQGRELQLGRLRRGVDDLGHAAARSFQNARQHFSYRVARVPNLLNPDQLYGVLMNWTRIAALLAVARGPRGRRLRRLRGQQGRLGRRWLGRRQEHALAGRLLDPGGRLRRDHPGLQEDRRGQGGGLQDVLRRLRRAEPRGRGRPEGRRRRVLARARRRQAGRRRPRGEGLEQGDAVRRLRDQLARRRSSSARATRRTSRPGTTW